MINRDDHTTETTPKPLCPHGLSLLIACPQCDPEGDEKARKQIVRKLEADRVAGKKLPKSL